VYMIKAWSIKIFWWFIIGSFVYWAINNVGRIEDFVASVIALAERVGEVFDSIFGAFSRISRS
jgi:hypothetical protein